MWQLSQALVSKDFHMLGIKQRPTLGVVIMHWSLKFVGWNIGCHFTIKYKTFLLLAVFFRCPTAIAQGRSKWPGPLHMPKLKFLKVPLVGTLNLCLKMTEKKQKTRNESDHPGLRKNPKTGEKWPILIMLNFWRFLDVFSAQDDRIHF